MDKRENIAVVDSQGMRTTVVKVTPQIPAGTFDDPSATLDGLPSYRLGDGTPLNVSGDSFVTPDGRRTFRRA